MSEEPARQLMSVLCSSPSPPIRTPSSELVHCKPLEIALLPHKLAEDERVVHIVEKSCGRLRRDESPKAIAQRAFHLNLHRRDTRVEVEQYIPLQGSSWKLTHSSLLWALQEASSSFGFRGLADI